MVDSSRPIMTTVGSGNTIVEVVLRLVVIIMLALIPLDLSMQHAKHAIAITHVTAGNAMEKQMSLKTWRPLDDSPEI